MIVRYPFHTVRLLWRWRQCSEVHLPQAMEVIDTGRALDALDSDGRTTATLPTKVTVATNWRALVPDRPAETREERWHTVGATEWLEIRFARERDIEHADGLVRRGMGRRQRPKPRSTAHPKGQSSRND